SRQRTSIAGPPRPRRATPWLDGGPRSGASTKANGRGQRLVRSGPAGHLTWASHRRRGSLRSGQSAHWDRELQTAVPRPGDRYHSGKLPDMCAHQPACPTADALDAHAAHVVAAHPEQGWYLLCNGVLLFDDGGELLPSGVAVAPRMMVPTGLRRSAA